MIVLLSIRQYHWWWTISLSLYHYPSVDTTAGGLIVYDCIIIHPSIPLLGDYKSIIGLLSISRCHCWWTISLCLYYYPSVDTTAGGLLIYVCIIIHRTIPLLGNYKSMFVSLSIRRYHCWWTNSLWLYYYPSVNTIAGGLIVYVCIIIHLSMPLKVD
jgi:hypothetical protein